MVKTHSFLLKKIKSKKAHVAVIGLGYVGLPLACEFALRGFKVTGIDLSIEKVRLIHQGKSYIEDVPSKIVRQMVKAKRLAAKSDFQALEDVDAVIICVPTPLNRSKDPDISFVVAAAEEIRLRLKPGQLIILESTTYPGTTEEVIQPCLEKSGLRAGKDFFLCFSPERVDPGNPDFKTRDIPKVVGGITRFCTQAGKELYSKITPVVVPVSSSRTAEMAKLLENTFRIVNIGLVNELAQAAESLGVNIWEAIDAAKTKPFGFMAFYPGPGIGGHCIGIDPLYLSWKARLHGAELHFIDLARRVNAQMPEYVVSHAVYTLNQRQHKAVSRSKILLLGASYKKDVSDTRESPAIDILREFKHLGAQINYHDPYVPELKDSEFSLKSQPLTPAVLKKQDLVVLTTNHSLFDLKSIQKHSRLIFDTRNAFKGFEQKNIVRL